jgi:Complex I intermediate-associated protein 30 (CIA30)
MRGDVSLENNGGFVQMALDLAPDGGVVDAGAWAGIELDVIGNDENYGLHLRTDAVERPWQSYRQSFRAGASWRTVQLAFADFVPHRIEVPLDIHRLRRIGLVAIGRAFAADLAVGGVRFFG